MGKVKIPEVRKPTAAQFTARVDERVAQYEQQRLDGLRRQAESEVAMEFDDELNVDRWDALANNAVLERGFTFLADVWPDHPAARHRVSVTVEGRLASRPCGIGAPWGLSKQGPTRGDYVMCSPLFPVHRGAKGVPPAVAVLVDKRWVTVPMSAGFTLEAVEGLAAVGLRFNSKLYRNMRAGAPTQELPPARLLPLFLEAALAEVPWVPDRSSVPAVELEAVG